MKIPDKHILFPGKGIFRIWFFFLIVLIGCMSPASIQAQYFSTDLLDGKEKISIPFEYKQGFIIVNVRFHRAFPLKFVFDTGAEHTLLLKKVYSDILDLPYQRKIKVLGSDMKSTISGLVCRDVYMELKNAALIKQDILVLEEDLYLLDELTGLKIDGILGANIFKHLVVQINYKKQVITLWDPEFFNPPKHYEVLDLTIHNNKPYVSCNTSLQNGEEEMAKLLLDTGASLHFLLHNNTNEHFRLPEIYTFGSIGYGLGGAIEGYLGMVNKIEVGESNFEHVVISFQEIDTNYIKREGYVRNGIIGNKLMERFDVMIDYYNAKLYLKPGKRVSKQFRYDKSGLVIYALGSTHDEFYIKDVIPDSPADRAGIKKGDVITRFQGVKSKNLDIERIFKVLSAKSGKRVCMKLVREGSEQKYTFRLEDFLAKALKEQN